MKKSSLMIENNKLKKISLCDSRKFYCHKEWLKNNHIL